MAASSPILTTSPPALSVGLALSSSNFPPSEEVELPVTVISHASAPITIFTWPTILNTRLALRRKNFECIDLDTNTPLNLEITKGEKLEYWTAGTKEKVLTPPVEPAGLAKNEDGPIELNNDDIEFVIKTGDT
ncbi:hypothetical protein MBLNU13_g11571t1 [Cladosporium sp. NU13]